MIESVRRKISEPRRSGLSVEELWFSDDHGLIACWEAGRKMANQDPDLAEGAKRDELPILAWKGGVEKPLKNPKKFGTYRYLAMWQGLRHEDLNIDPTTETELTCSRTGVTVIYTPDSKKYSTP